MNRVSAPTPSLLPLRHELIPRRWVAQGTYKYPKGRRSPYVPCTEWVICILR